MEVQRRKQSCPHQEGGTMVKDNSLLPGIYQPLPPLYRHWVRVVASLMDEDLALLGLTVLWEQLQEMYFQHFVTKK